VRTADSGPASVANLDYFTKAGQEAGVMFSLYRKQDSNEVVVYITKGRHGGTGGKIKMDFNVNVQTFEEAEGGSHAYTTDYMAGLNKGRDHQAEGQDNRGVAAADRRDGQGDNAVEQSEELDLDGDIDFF